MISRLNEIVAAGTPKFERYPKGGTKAILTRTVEQTNWSDAVFETLNLAQAFGRSWTIMGAVEDELVLVGDSFAVSGVSWAMLRIERAGRA